MKKIKTILLRNFQCHKKLTVKLADNFTSIVGDNNGGKSAIVRALYWAFTNSPRSDWMCRLKGDKRLTATVTIEFDDGTVLTRKKGKNINQYILNGEKFEKFKFEVPQPIKDYLGQLMVTCGDKTLLPMIAMDEDQPFLTFESSVVRGSMLNYLTGIDIADKWKRDFLKDAKAYQNRQREYTATAAAAKEELVQYKGLDKATKKSIAVQKQLKAIGVHQERLNTLRELKGRLSEVKTAQRQYKAAPKVKVLVVAFKKLTEQYLEMVRLLGRVKAHLKDKESNKSNLETARAELEKYNVCPTCGATVTI